MKRESLLNLGTAVMVGCALLVTALVVRREFFPPRPVTFNVDAEPNWRSYAVGHRIGPLSAKVTIVEFSDFECPACRMFAGHLRTLRERYPNDIAVVYRHFPIRSHRFALAAARASECAASQGRFEEMHNALFGHADSLGVAPWPWFARIAGVADTAAFAACAGERGPIPHLAADTAAARAIKLVGTPTVLVNDMRFTGVPPLDSLDAVVKRAMRSTIARRD